MSPRGLHQNRDAFPDEQHRCWALVIRRTQDAALLDLHLNRIQLVRSPLDSNKLFSQSTERVAAATCKTVGKKRVSVEIALSNGRLERLNIDGVSVKLHGQSPSADWSTATPVRYGFLIIDGQATVENATFAVKD